MSESIKNKLDNFDLSTLSEREFKQYRRCLDNPMSKRASMLYLIDNLDNLTYDLQMLKFVIDKNENNA